MFKIIILKFLPFYAKYPLQNMVEKNKSDTLAHGFVIINPNSVLSKNRLSICTKYFIQRIIDNNS
jgi:hypothetical protein